MVRHIEAEQVTEARVSLATLWAGNQGTCDQLCAVPPPIDRRTKPAPPTATHVSGVVQLTSTRVGPLSTQFHFGAVLIAGVVAVGDVGVVVVVAVGGVVVVGSLVGETPLVVVVESGVDAPTVAETGNATTTMETASNMASPTV